MVGVRGLAANGVSISDPHVIQITVDANESLSWMDLCRRVGLFPLRVGVRNDSSGTREAKSVLA
jgi:hypothetical protein